MTVQDRLFQMFTERRTLTTSDIAREFNGSNGLICSSPMEQMRKLRMRLERDGGATITAEKVEGRSIYRYTLVEAS